MEEKLGIAGSGAIATGLAACATRTNGHVLWARSDASAERATKAIAKACERLGEGYDPASVTVTTDLAALGDATFVVEAVAEDVALKRELLARLDEVAADDAVLSTTTSSLSVSDLAAASGRPERFVGLHVFNPVPRMRLVELAFPAEASAETRERTAALCAALDKEPVDVPDLAGFVVNRLLFPYLFSAVDFMEQTGLAPASIDTCMQLGAAHPMGPIALLDYIGLDVSVAIGDAIAANVPQRLRDLCAEGALGRKSGRGLYPPEFYAR
ncbi:MAG TPA: 3-hydroxyacyl-CoA dehydrogenase NAD-binding domain-containing protein [Solirubrobacteraceae bacterium]|nr:3-hydroxyacyl-CoA dehydrogenase NAD-binding domain-containing protein [Solirubrobacteraceae bacterium]